MAKVYVKNQNRKAAQPAHVRHPKHKMLRDMLIIAASFCVAIWLVRLGAFDFLVGTQGENSIIASFVAGALFTSSFTIAPATVVLADLSNHISPYQVAFWGAFGSVLGDLIIFIFIKNNLAKDAEDLLKHSSYRRLMSIFHLRFFRWLTPLLGALVIVSPLPDEIGLAMMGFSKMKLKIFIPLDFVLSYAGILLICLVALSLG